MFLDRNSVIDEQEIVLLKKKEKENNSIYNDTFVAKPFEYSTRSTLP